LENQKVVKNLMRRYEQWWDHLESERKFDYARTIIGSPKQKVVKLTCQQWHSPLAPYNQSHVLGGLRTNGMIDLEVAKPGKYQFELRRWPRELDLEIQQLPPEIARNPRKLDIKNKFLHTKGRRIFASKAVLEIDDLKLESRVLAKQKRVIFKLDLKPGPVNLKTYFVEPNDESVGAYYVYVTKLVENPDPSGQ
ncbi:MAG: hypothetical protein AAF623_04935, partial [Planctomycetota bacterium]